MKIRKLFIQLVIAVPLFLSMATPAFAVQTPDFGSCVNPQGTKIVSYDSGSHGVAGRTDYYTGSDAVYRQSDNALTQCLCPDNGNGIQTNWLKASSLKENDVVVLGKEGWVYVITGSPWGLEDSAYLAKNSDYACKASAAVTPTPVKSTLGLASTGNILFIDALIISGGLSLITGMVLLRLSRYR